MDVSPLKIFGWLFFFPCLLFSWLFLIEYDFVVVVASLSVCWYLFSYVYVYLTMQALLRNATEAMKEAKVPDILNSVSYKLTKIFDSKILISCLHFNLLL